MSLLLPPREIDQWRQELASASAREILEWAGRAFDGRIALASSLGLEDQVLTDMIAREGLPISIFTLDTGRLFPETLALIQRTTDRYGLPVKVFFPRTEAVEQMVAEEGIDLFRRSVELRRRCCHVRKVEPLERALAGLDGWICGLRRGQAQTRLALEPIEWDATHGLLKLNPLAGWSEAEVWAYVREHDVPYNPLHERGFPSIGCACCTRAVEPGEDIRAGRWWWENPEHKECGLHLSGGHGRSAGQV